MFIIFDETIIHILSKIFVTMRNDMKGNAKTNHLT